MIKQLLRIALCGCLLSETAPAGLYVTHADAETTETQEYNAEQLDALLAPIALYPDPLLAQVLMASTFPLEVVTAGRWIEDPANKPLSGDALAEAVKAETWDPSVKSLVPFPSVLALLNSNLDWTQQLGYAFADQQEAVMDSVQRLRLQAQSTGNLQTTEQQIVHTEQQVITIEPAQPTVVYVPNYNPTVVYGAWPYPAYPPVYLPPPPGYTFGTARLAGWRSPRALRSSAPCGAGRGPAGAADITSTSTAITTSMSIAPTSTPMSGTQTGPADARPDCSAPRAAQSAAQLGQMACPPMRSVVPTSTFRRAR